MEASFSHEIPPTPTPTDPVPHVRYEAAALNAAALQLPYTALASLLHASPDEIAVMGSATLAWQAVVYGLAWTWRPGDTVLTGVNEYASNYLAYLQLARRTGARIVVVPETAQAELDLTALAREIAAAPRRPVLLALTHSPTNSGRIYDAAGAGAVARAHAVPFLLDACQSVGQVPVDVQAIGCDFLSSTSRKYLRGPRGVGFLYAARCVCLWGGWIGGRGTWKRGGGGRGEMVEVQKVHPMASGCLCP